jgi:lipopolysaccharide/colanic/teichoic acid biosynthesis glycosyltransferase
MLFRRAVAVTRGKAEQPQTMYTAVREVGEGLARSCDLAAVRERYLRYAPLKRAFDVVNALLLLVVFSPLFLLSALAVKLADGGPVFFRQQRLTGGLAGPRTFEILKLRTMVVNAEKLGAKITMRRDPRITGVGRVLRWFKLDELPQLINILRGDMSFVGPRPQTLGYVEQFREHYEAVHSIVPAGLTDLATLKYRDEALLLESAPDKERFYCDVIMPDKIAYHYAYLAKLGLGEDLAILGRTLFYVFCEKPARRIARWFGGG